MSSYGTLTLTASSDPLLRSSPASLDATVDAVGAGSTDESGRLPALATPTVDLRVDPGEAAARVRADEAVLISRCRLGDRVAMRTLYERFRRRIYSLVMRIAGEQEADELCQEVFLKAFRNLDKFRGDAQLGTWLYRLAVNAALTHVTRDRGRYKVSDEVLLAVPAPTSAELSDGDPRVRRRIEAALALLPAGYRAVIVLHDIEGLQHEEIAEVLGCRVGTSKSQLHKARAKMREILGPQLAAERGA